MRLAKPAKYGRRRGGCGGEAGTENKVVYDTGGRVARADVGAEGAAWSDYGAAQAFGEAKGASALGATWKSPTMMNGAQRARVGSGGGHNGQVVVKELPPVRNYNE